MIFFIHILFIYYENKNKVQNIKVFLYKFHDIFSFYKHHIQIILFEKIHIYILWVIVIYVLICENVTWTSYFIE